LENISDTILEQFWEQGVQGVFKPKLQKRFSYIFFLDFWANVSDIAFWKYFHQGT